MTPLLLSLLALAAAPPSAPAPVDEARFQRFMEVLPETSSPAAPAANPAELAELAKLNPGRERDIAAVLEADARCTAPVSRGAVLRMAHIVADRLGPEKLDRMIAFYQSPDFKTIDRLAPRAAAGPALSDAEKAEMERIRAAYPLDAFAAAMQASANSIWEDPETAAGLAKCADSREAAFQRAKLRQY